MATDGEQLRDYIDKQIKRKSAIAKELGITRTTLYQYFQSRTLTEDIKNKFENYFGKNIFNNDFASTDKTATDQNNVIPLKKNVNGYTQQRWQNKLSAGAILVPLIPIKAQAGYAKTNDIVEFLLHLEKYPIPPGVDYRGYEWCWFEVEGDSMLPNFHEGDFILCSLVPSDQWKKLERDHPHVLVTEEKGVLLKRILQKSKDEWWLESDNKQYKDEPIKVKEIKEVWKFRKKLSDRDRIEK